MTTTSKGEELEAMLHMECGIEAVGVWAGEWKSGGGDSSFKYLKHYQGKGKFDLLSVVIRIELVTIVYHEYSSLYYKPYAFQT